MNLGMTASLCQSQKKPCKSYSAGAHAFGPPGHFAEDVVNMGQNILDVNVNITHRRQWNFGVCGKMKRMSGGPALEPPDAIIPPCARLTS